jgi:DNA replication protein DnaC
MADSIITSEQAEHYWKCVDHWAKDYVLPSKFNDADILMLPDSNEKELLKAFDLNDDFGFLIYGQSGIGKTYTLCAFLNKILWASYNAKYSMQACVAYYPVGILRQKLLSLDKKEETFERCEKVKFLFLDDLGTELTTDYARESLFTIFDIRCQQKKPTFITTNLNPAELKEKYGERVTSRFKEMCVILELKGQDKRTDIYKERIQKLKQRATEGSKPS